MAKCKLCGKEKFSSSTCIEFKIRVKGEFYDPIPYKARNKSLYERHNKILKNCPSCGVKEGGFHHVGCILEICPVCNGFWGSCRCFGIKVKYNSKGAEIIPFPAKEVK